MRSILGAYSFDTHLTNLAVNFCDKDAAWQKIVPILPSPSSLVKYPKFDDDMEAFRELQKAQIKKVGDSKPGRISATTTMVPAVIEPYHLMTKWISETDINEEALVGQDPVESQTLAVVQTLNTHMDIDLFNMLTGVSVTWDDFPAANKWNVANGDPEDDVLQVCDLIETSNGGKKRPNTMVMGRTAFRAMISRNNKMRSDLKYVVANRDDMVVIIKGLFTLDNVIIVPSAKNTAAKGKSASMSAIWGAKAWIGHIEQGAPSKDNPSAIYGISLKMQGNDNRGIRVTKLDTRGSMTADGVSGVEARVEIYTNFFQTSRKLGRTISNIY